MDHLSELDVLADTYNCAMNICHRGTLDKTEFGYYADIVIRDAAKFAYLVRLIQAGKDEVKHYKPEMDDELAGALIQNQSLNKLNRIKKISLEAFFYLLEIEKMAEN